MTCLQCRRESKPLCLTKGKTLQIAEQKYIVEDVCNYEVLPLPFSFTFQSFSHPKVKALRKTNKLDKVIEPWRDKGEFKQQLALRQWLSSAWTAGMPSVKHPSHLSCKSMQIDKMLHNSQKHGATHFCTYKATATCEAFNSFGWTARLVNSVMGKNGTTPGGGPHMINEVWSNEYKKWYFSDSLFNIHAVGKNGIPLSCAEMREEFFRNRGRDVKHLWGVNEIKLPYDLTAHNHCQNHEWFVIYSHNNFYDSEPDGGILYPLLMLKDCHKRKSGRKKSETKRNVMIGSGNVVAVESVDDLNFSLNICEIMAQEDSEGIKLRVPTRTPGLKQIWYRVNRGKWSKFVNNMVIKLNSKTTELRVKSENQVGVFGIESYVVLKLKE
jgi:hypothetical protein